MCWHTGTAKIVYDPYRPGLKTKTNWWCVANVDEEITRYYRWWIQRIYHVKGLVRQSWSAHISIIRGEFPGEEYKHLWGKYNNQIVEFKYKHHPRRNSKGFWFVDVDCRFFTNIRKEMNKPHDWVLHLTVGKESF